MSKMILIIEDEESIQNIIKAFLEDAGYTVALAADGLEEIEQFRENKPDLVLLDLMLPKVDGLAVCEILRKESQVPIIMLYEYAHHIKLLPYALNYLTQLKTQGIKLAVATGLPEKLYVPCLKNNSILGLFDALCSTDEVHRGKEYPDIFEYAAQKLSVAPERCIVFDDVLPAIRSAKQAKMLAGGVYDKYSADQRREIEKIADIYLLDFKLAPIPRNGV